MSARGTQPVDRDRPAGRDQRMDCDRPADRNAARGDRPGPRPSRLAPRRRAFPVAAVTGLGAGVALLMAAALVHGVTTGSFVEEGGRLLALAWGRVAVIDVYAGFALFAAWIWHREPRAWAAGAWIVALCLLGNLVAGCYVVLAARGCRGSASRFWLGPRRAGVVPREGDG